MSRRATAVSARLSQGRASSCQHASHIMLLQRGPPESKDLLKLSSALFEAVCGSPSQRIQGILHAELQALGDATMPRCHGRTYCRSGSSPRRYIVCPLSSVVADVGNIRTRIAPGHSILFAPPGSVLHLPPPWFSTSKCESL